MNQQIQSILERIQQIESLNDTEKAELSDKLAKADKALSIAEFKLERTEKVKRTTAILLEETIAELEAKRIAVQKQNKELETESALERVRTVAMGMRKSDDLFDICQEVYNALSGMGFDSLRNAMINIYDDEDRTFLNYDYSEKHGKIVSTVSYDGHPAVEKHIAQIKNSDDAFVEIMMDQKDIQHWKDYLVSQNMQTTYTLDQISNLYYYFYSIGIGAIGISTFSPITDPLKEVLKRFRNVFELAYQRYIDITAAEEQAKEAQIEAAMERIRALAMAMHSSDDLAKTVDAFFTELNLLGGTPRRCGVGFINKETKVATLKATSSTEEKDQKMIDGQLTLAGHPILDGIYEHWIKQEEYHPVLRGNEIRDYYKAMDPEVHFPEFSKDEVQYGYYFYFKEGGVYAWTEHALEERDLRLYRKFTAVLSLAHRRYMDLRQAELRAKEAVIQASLDRVRGQIASMRSIEDLDQITPVIWNELTTLSVPFTRCGVFIIEEENPNVKVFLSSPDGRSLGLMNLPKDANELTIHAVNSWQKNQVYATHWNKQQFIAWVDSMFREGYIQDKESYQDSRQPPESLYLHFVPYEQGMLYVGNDTELVSEDIDLVKSLAEAFSIAYARYDDFNKLERAKHEVESALSDLKATQSQLIQSEKMASLGELTAGIAHEIQNPLNFVNNFSEVSEELIDEMKEELDAGNYDDAKEIADDVKTNLDKIRHHGKRADGIVKGMLQHSRKGSGTKELTDINELTDEYLRLAYHGLRAKDKSFNAELIKHFDEQIDMVNVISQDIGRVILNLITNAFHAVNEKQRKSSDGYKPIVTVSTKNTTGHIQITVTDNGNGIPQSILEKVFQPFFTTKPTSQGTGLGLSLAYDIVKAHGGNIEVETEQGKGSTFFVTIAK